MPIYEYQCTACGHEAEVFQRMSDPDETTCPSCGKDQFQRLISAAGFRLKGGGWYETDFKSGSKRNVVDSGGGSDKSGSSGSSDSSASSKSESSSKAAAA